jgi:hypothetical protein
MNYSALVNELTENYAMYQRVCVKAVGANLADDVLQDIAVKLMSESVDVVTNPKGYILGAIKFAALKATNASVNLSLDATLGDDEDSTLTLADVVAFRDYEAIELDETSRFASLQAHADALIATHGEGAVRALRTLQAVAVGGDYSDSVMSLVRGRFAKLRAKYSTTLFTELAELMKGFEARRDEFISIAC